MRLKAVLEGILLKAKTTEFFRKRYRNSYKTKYDILAEIL